MHRAMKALPVVEDYGDGFCSRLVEWGGMIVSYETFPKGVDATPLFKGLPDDMCQSPHWGYVLKGRVRIKRADGDAVLKTGDVYYLNLDTCPSLKRTPRFSNSVRRRSTSGQSTLPRTWLQRKQRRDSVCCWPDRRFCQTRHRNRR